MTNRIEILVTTQQGDEYYVDLIDSNINIALNYSIDDVRTIETKNGNFSKTFVVPGTKNNNRLFSNLFDINTTFTIFDPNKRVDATILQNSTPLISGYLQLKKVKKINNTDLQGNQIEYEIIVFDSSVDFFQQLGDNELTDINLSAYTHTYDRTTIENAWSGNTYQNIYQYPLMDKIGQYDIFDFKPAFYSKGLLIELANNYGYTLEGDFIENDEVFDKEVILWDGNKPEITASEAVSREFNAEATGGTVNMGSTIHNVIDTQITGISNNLNFNDEVFDNSNTYTFNLSESGSTDYSQWEVSADGTYSLTIRANFDITYSADTVVNTFLANPIGGALNGDRRPQPTVIIQLYDVDTNTAIPGAEAVSILGVNQYYDFTTPGTDYTIGGDGVWRFPNLNLNDGTKIKAVASIGSSFAFGWLRSPSINVDVHLDLVFNDTLDAGGRSRFFNKTELNSTLEYGDDVNLTSFLPKDMKQRDFISDIIKRYNVYIRPNPRKNKTLILESRDKFYENTTVLDWTNKKDYSSEDQIAFLSELQNKEILFTYKEDNSAEGADGVKWNERYTRLTGDIYGQKSITFDNDFVKGTKKIESKFSSAPLLFREDNNVIVPAVNTSIKKRNPVVAYYGGLIDVKNEFGDNTTYNIDWSGTTVSYSQYPYAGHYDNPYEPTKDIHFGEVTYEWIAVLLDNITDNNLFNRYWRNYINQISTGKLVTSYFYLTETDINAIKDDLSPRIFVKDSYYNINKIIDYKPLSEGLTKVELLRIDNGTTFVPTTGSTSTIRTGNSRNVVAFEGTDSFNAGPFTTSPNNIVNSRDVMVIGQNNYVGALSTGTISGNNNRIGGGAENVNVQGNNNVVKAGLKNVTIVGDDITATESNTSYITGDSGLWKYNNDNNNINSVSSTNDNNIGINVSDSFIGGGYGHDISGAVASSSIIAGIQSNITSNLSFIGGGASNEITADNNGIVAGFLNTINGGTSFIGGGTNNGITDVSANNSSIIAGENNDLTSSNSAIIGGNNITGTLDNTVYVPAISFGNEGVRWQYIEIEIGTWNMDTTASITVGHGAVPTWNEFRNISFIIRNDALNEHYSCPEIDASISVDSGTFNLSRETGGKFDNANFSSTAINRGWITFWRK